MASLGAKGSAHRELFALLLVGASVVFGAASACSGDEVDPGGGGGGSSSSGGGSSSSGPPGASGGCAAYAGAGFCDDFEVTTTETLKKNWTGPEYAGLFVSPTVVTSSDAYSPTHVLHAEADFVSEAGNDGQRSAIVTRGLPTMLPSQSLHVGFSFRTVRFTTKPGGYTKGPSPSIHLTFRSSTGMNTCGIQIQAANVSATDYALNACGQQGPGRGPTAYIPFVLGQWQRVEIDVSFAPTDAAVGGARIRVDGKEIAAVPLRGALNVDPGTYSGNLTLGAFAFDQVPSLAVEYDDVVIAQR